MFKIFHRFFRFCSPENRRKFYVSIFLGVMKAVCEALKFPAIAIIMQGILSNDLTVGAVLSSFGIMTASVICHAVVNYFSTMQQCEAGYGTCADKRIEIAEHLKYLPMGYFNNNSLGYITSVATNTMEHLADVATRVVMLVTQGILTTLIITAMMFLFDVRIGLTALAGVGVYFLINTQIGRVFV